MGLRWAGYCCCAALRSTHRVRGAPLWVVPIRDKEVFCLGDDAHMTHLDLNGALTRRDLQSRAGLRAERAVRGRQVSRAARQVLVQAGRQVCMLKAGWNRLGSKQAALPAKQGGRNAGGSERLHRARSAALASDNSSRPCSSA